MSRRASSSTLSASSTTWLASLSLGLSADPTPVRAPAGAAAWTQAFLHLLPRGAAWPREHGATLVDFAAVPASPLAALDARAVDLLEQDAVPWRADEGLADWERALGLPDPCMGPGLSPEHRRTMVGAKLAALGGASRAYFVALAAAVGWSITIEELAPVMCGWSECGDPFWEIGSDDIRFYWIVRIGGVPIWWFRCGEGEAGKDWLADWTSGEDVECLLRRAKPAHTQVIFDYSEAVT